MYPVNKSKIIKVSLFGLKLSKKTLKEISKILHKYEVIHSSGILKIKSSLTYECYLNLSLTEKQSEDLNSSLNKKLFVGKSNVLPEAMIFANLLRNL